MLRLELPIYRCKLAHYTPKDATIRPSGRGDESVGRGQGASARAGRSGRRHRPGRRSQVHERPASYRPLDLKFGVPHSRRLRRYIRPASVMGAAAPGGNCPGNNWVSDGSRNATSDFMIDGVSTSFLFHNLLSSNLAGKAAMLPTNLKFCHFCSRPSGGTSPTQPAAAPSRQLLRGSCREARTDALHCWPPALRGWSYTPHSWGRTTRHGQAPSNLPF